MDQDDFDPTSNADRHQLTNALYRLCKHGAAANGTTTDSVAKEFFNHFKQVISVLDADPEYEFNSIVTKDERGVVVSALRYRRPE